MRAVFYLIRLALYVVLRLLYLVYVILVFLSKPGARWLVPIAAIGLVIWQWDLANQFVARPEIIGFLDDWIPADPSFTEPFVVAVVALFCLAIFVISHILRTVLGSFPPLRRPIAPRLALRANNRLRRPAPVKTVVPALKHRFRAEHQPDMVQRLPEAVRGLLEPPESPKEALEVIVSVIPPSGPSEPAQAAPQAEVSVAERAQAIAPPPQPEKPTAPPQPTPPRRKPPMPPRANGQPPLPRQVTDDAQDETVADVAPDDVATPEAAEQRTRDADIEPGP